MTATLVPGYFGTGRVGWEGERDNEGHRTYPLLHRVKADLQDGPNTVMNCPGLPSIGSPWNFGNDLDVWAFCQPYMKVTPDQQKAGEASAYWIVEQRFSTRPISRCQDTQIEDPLLEPDRISGNSVKYTVEASYDRFGNPIISSSWERFRGPQVEFDANRAAIRIEQNVADLEWSTVTAMLDTVNDATLWGYGARQVKLSSTSFERHRYGTCNFYYTRIFDFDVARDGFDREIPDEGTKVLWGHWEFNAWVLDTIAGITPQQTNPQHFMQFKDRAGENCRTPLDGLGKPFDASGTGVQPSFSLEYYPESNFLLLGIPSSLEG